MKVAAYHRMAREESEHWFYLARAKVLESLLKQYVLPECPRPEILDVGCGTGGTTSKLSEFGNVVGVEPSSIAIELFAERYPELTALQGSIYDLPDLVDPERFDVVTILGVLYHRQVPDPFKALEMVSSRVRSGGWLLWSDCVYPCLAREHDEFVEGDRRFMPRQMHQLVEAAGFEVISSTHLVAWGFPIAFGLSALYRFVRWRRRNCTDDEFTSAEFRSIPKWLNSALAKLTYAEWRLAEWGLKAPLGVSRIILARKRVRPVVSAAPALDTSRVALVAEW